MAPAEPLRCGGQRHELHGRGGRQQHVGVASVDAFVAVERPYVHSPDRGSDLARGEQPIQPPARSELPRRSAPPARAGSVMPGARAESAAEAGAGTRGSAPPAAAESTGRSAPVTAGAVSTGRFPASSGVVAPGKEAGTPARAAHPMSATAARISPRGSACRRARSMLRTDLSARADGRNIAIPLDPRRDRRFRRARRMINPPRWKGRGRPALRARRRPRPSPGRPRPARRRAGRR